MQLQYEKTPRSTVKRVLAAGAALAGSAALAFGLFGYHADTFHHDHGRLLTEIASAKGIEVTFRPSTTSSTVPQGVAFKGYLFPKTGVDGQLSFDGRIAYNLLGSQYQFTLLDDKGYATVTDSTGRVVRNECLLKDNTPPLAMFTDALKEARVIDAVANPQFDLKCKSGKLVEVDFAAEPYVFCSGTKDGSITFTGDDLEASVQLLTKSTEGFPALAELQAPAGIDLAKCESLTATATGATRSLKEKTLQRAKDAMDVVTGTRRMASMGSSDCSCKDGLKQCLFVHGLGYNDTATTATFPEYFGTIEQQAKCCSSVQFLHIDTLNSAWYDDKATTKLCDEAAALSTGKDKMAIENVAIVAHSMGNLVTASSLMQNKCGLAKSSKWIALAGPMSGSASAASAVNIFSKLPASLVQRLCTNDPNTKIDDPIVNTLLFFGLCPTRIAISSIVFKGSAPSTPQLDALFTAASEQFGKSVTSSLCAVNPVGLLTTDSIQLSALGLISGHASLENDGQVHYDSCRATLAKSLYSTAWDGGKYYKPNINHLDATFRNGDGWWGKDRKPIKWFNCQF